MVLTEEWPVAIEISKKASCNERNVLTSMANQCLRKPLRIFDMVAGQSADEVRSKHGFRV